MKGRLAAFLGPQLGAEHLHGRAGATTTRYWGEPRVQSCIPPRLIQQTMMGTAINGTFIPLGHESVGNNPPFQGNELLAAPW